MSNKKLEIDVEVLRGLCKDMRNWGLHGGVIDKAERALKEYDAAQNPLDTPWVAKKDSTGHYVQMMGRNISVCAGAPLTEAQARLLSAAPGLADIAERFLSETLYGSDLLRYDAAQALKKAGRYE